MSTLNFERPRLTQKTEARSIRSIRVSVLTNPSGDSAAYRYIERRVCQPSFSKNVCRNTGYRKRTGYLPKLSVALYEMTSLVKAYSSS